LGRGYDAYPEPSSSAAYGAPTYRDTYREGSERRQFADAGYDVGWRNRPRSPSPQHHHHTSKPERDESDANGRRAPKRRSPETTATATRPVRDSDRKRDSSTSSSSDSDGPSRRDRHRRRHRSSRRHGRRHAESSADESGSRHVHRSTLKPEKFDGQGCFETFLVQFQNCALYNKWRATDKLANLRWSLAGTAAQLLHGAEDLDYDQLLEKLKRRYGGKGMEEKFQCELRCRRRGPKESLRELAQDIQRLMSLAYPGEKSSMAEKLARDSFLTALDDPELDIKIREREPPDLDTALQIAQRYEVFKATAEASSSAHHRVTRQTHVEPPPDDYATLNAKLVKAIEAIGDLTAKRSTTSLEREVDELRKEVDRLRHLQNLSQNDRGLSGDSDSRVCYHCGKSGHFRRECPQRSNQPPATSQDARSTNVRQISSVQASWQRDVYLSASIAGRTCNCLLDTGSEVSLLPASLVESSLTQPTRLRLSAANGSQINVQGEATLNMKVGEFNTTVTGLVSDHIVDIILGIDWLTETGAVWDFRRSRIELGGSMHPLHSLSSRTVWCNRVVFQEDLLSSGVSRKSGCPVADLQQVEEVEPADGRHGDGTATPLRHRQTSSAAPDGDCAAHEGRVNSVCRTDDVPDFGHRSADAMSRMPCGGKGCVCEETEVAAPVGCIKDGGQALIGGPADRPGDSGRRQGTKRRKAGYRAEVRKSGLPASRLRDVVNAGEPTPAGDISGATTVGLVPPRSELRSDSPSVLSPAYADVPVGVTEDLVTTLLKTTHNNGIKSYASRRTKRVRRAPDRFADCVW
jgi:predicted aspartyl protease